MTKAMHWISADTIAPKEGETYLVWTDAKTNVVISDPGMIAKVHLWPADTLQMYIKKQIPNWRPLYAALVTKP